MKAKKVPPGWDKTGRKSGVEYEPCNKEYYTTRRTELQARFYAVAVETGVSV